MKKPADEAPASRTETLHPPSGLDGAGPLRGAGKIVPGLQIAGAVLFFGIPFFGVGP
jgi:hypothetical protein